MEKHKNYSPYSKTLKFLFWGSNSVGKTSIIKEFIEKPFLNDETRKKTAKHPNAEQKQLILYIYDSESKEEQVKQSDIHVIVFSVCDPESFEEAKSIQQNELKNKNVIFVGNKIDLRDIDDKNHIQKETAENELKDTAYIECTIKDHNQVKNIFDEAIKRFDKVDQAPEDHYCKVYCKASLCQCNIF